MSGAGDADNRCEICLQKNPDRPGFYVARCATAPPGRKVACASLQRMAKRRLAARAAEQPAAKEPRLAGAYAEEKNDAAAAQPDRATELIAKLAPGAGEYAEECRIFDEISTLDLAQATTRREQVLELLKMVQSNTPVFRCLQEQRARLDCSIRDMNIANKRKNKRGKKDDLQKALSEVTIVEMVRSPPSPERVAPLDPYEFDAVYTALRLAKTPENALDSMMFVRFFFLDEIVYAAFDPALPPCYRFLWDVKALGMTNTDFLTAADPARVFTSFSCVFTSSVHLFRFDNGLYALRDGLHRDMFFDCELNNPIASNVFPLVFHIRSFWKTCNTLYEPLRYAELERLIVSKSLRKENTAAKRPRLKKTCDDMLAHLDDSVQSTKLLVPKLWATPVTKPPYPAGIEQLLKPPKVHLFFPSYPGAFGTEDEISEARKALRKLWLEWLEDTPDADAVIDAHLREADTLALSFTQESVD